MDICDKCKRQLKVGAFFCNECGMAVKTEKQSQFSEIVAKDEKLQTEKSENIPLPLKIISYFTVLFLIITSRR